MHQLKGYGKPSRTPIYRAVGLSRTNGTIEEGKVADLLAVQGDPTVGISDLRNTVLVMKDGLVVRNILNET